MQTTPEPQRPHRSGPRRTDDRRLRRTGVLGIAAALALLTVPAAALAAPATAPAHGAFPDSGSADGPDVTGGGAQVVWKPCLKRPVPVNVSGGAHPSGTSVHRRATLPGGATLSVWSYPTTFDGYDTTGYVAVTAFEPRTAHYKLSALSKGVTSFAQMVDQVPDPRTVAAINGDYWDYNNYTIIRGAQVSNGSLQKAYASPTPVVGMTKDFRMRSGQVRISGTVSVARDRYPIAALNGHSTGSAGMNVVNSMWGDGPRPFVGGTTEVLVRDEVGGTSPGKVWVVRVATSGGSGTRTVRPPNGHRIIAATGAMGARLATLRPGNALAINYDQVWDGPPVVDGIGHGRFIVQGGASIITMCTANWESQRPRAMVAWTADGSRGWLITANTVQKTTGWRAGGVSVWAMADLADRLGATEAVLVDGGTSTTMVVKSRVATGQRALRVDLPEGNLQRRVVNGIGLTVR